MFTHGSPAATHQHRAIPPPTNAVADLARAPMLSSPATPLAAVAEALDEPATDLPSAMQVGRLDVTAMHEKEMADLCAAEI